MKSGTLGRRLALTPGVVLLPLAVLLGLVGAAGGFVGTAVLTAEISLLSAAGLVICFAVATGLGWLAGMLIGWLHRWRIGAETVILIGESWGAELAGLYLVAHPERVERLVLVSPGALYERGWGDRDPCDLIARAPAEVQEQFDLLAQPVSLRLRRCSK